MLRNKKGSAGIRSRADRASKVKINVEKKEFVRNPYRQKFYAFKKYIQNYRLEIFWLSLYTIVTAAIFAERCYCKFD